MLRLESQMKGDIPLELESQNERELFLGPESHNRNSHTETEWTTSVRSKVMGIPVLGLGWSLTPVG